MRSERAWAIARADGSIVTGMLPPPLWPRVPFLRVVASLVQGLRLGLTGPARRSTTHASLKGSWRLWQALAAAEGVVLGLSLALGRLHPPAFDRPALVIGLWLAAIGVFRLLTPAVQWRYHGAEHKAVTAYERGVDLSETGSVLQCPRLHARCGTNLMVWLVVFSPLLTRLPGIVQVAVLPLALAVVAEGLTLLTRRPQSVVARGALAPGYLMQAWITTREPSLTEQQVGCAALTACLAQHQVVVDAEAAALFHP